MDRDREIEELKARVERLERRTADDRKRTLVSAYVKGFGIVFAVLIVLFVAIQFIGSTSR